VRIKNADIQSGRILGRAKRHPAGCRAANPPERRILIFYQFKSLFPVERELIVIADKGYAIAESMRYDYVIAGVIVLLHLVYNKAGVAVIVLFVEIEDLEVVVVFILETQHLNKSDCRSHQ
jgi:hypothetical protein